MPTCDLLTKKEQNHLLKRLTSAFSMAVIVKNLQTPHQWYNPVALSKGFM
jgi:hypothetical protein